MTKFNCPRCRRAYKQEIKDKIAFCCDNCRRKFEVTMAGGIVDIPLPVTARFSAFVGGERGGPGSIPGEVR